MLSNTKMPNSKLLVLLIMFFKSVCVHVLMVYIPELIILGAVQHGIILLAYEEWASEGRGLCCACSAFLPKVLSGCSEGHCSSVLFITWECSQVFTFSHCVCVCVCTLYL